MAFQVVIDRLAANDLQNIFDYIAERNPQGATNVLADITKTIDLLSDYPNLGRKVKLRSVRIKVTAKYRYRILYEVNTEQITIRQVVHPSRNLP